MPPAELTTLLLAWRAGDPAAAEQLVERVYQELYRRAQHQLAREQEGYHTLSPTALVHETLDRLLHGAPVDWQCTAHFFVVAAQQMRRILIDAARRAPVRQRHQTEHRWQDGERQRRAPQETDQLIDLLALDEALTRLAAEAPRAARIVELRYFGGLTEAEAARVSGLSVSQLKRDWEWAKAKLYGWLTTAPRELG